MKSVSTVRRGVTFERVCRTKKRELKAGASRRAQGAAKTLEGHDSTEEEETVNWGEVHALGME